MFYCARGNSNFSLSAGRAGGQSAPGAAVIVFALRRPVRFLLCKFQFIVLFKPSPWGEGAPKGRMRGTTRLS